MGRGLPRGLLGRSLPTVALRSVVFRNSLQPMKRLGADTLSGEIHGTVVISSRLNHSFQE